MARNSVQSTEQEIERQDAGGQVPGGESSGAGPVGQDVNPYGAGPYAPQPTPTTTQSKGPAPGPSGGTGGHAAGQDPLVKAGFSQAYANELYALQDEWEQLSGYAQPISTDQLIAMAKQHITGLTSFASYVWSNVLPQKVPQGQFDVKQAMPWLQFGMDQDTYHSKLSQLSNDWLRYTGDVLNPLDAGLGQQWTQQQLQGVAAGFASPSIVDDPAMQKAFGWIQYGLTFRDFMLKKQTMEDAFGSPLTKDQAVTQLHYFHAAQGASAQAHATARQPGQPAASGQLATGTVR